MENPPTYGVDEFGSVSGVDNMQAEILNRGPISCTIAVTQAFEDYSGGVFVDTTGAKSLDHEISVVGWGVDQGNKYWIGRNSWGTYWYDYKQLLIFLICSTFFLCRR